MEDNIGNYYIINGTLIGINEVEYIYKDKDRSVYEVIRIIEGIPLFYEDHYTRMKNSLDSLGFALEIDDQELKKQIKQLIAANSMENCNIKIVVCSGQVPLQLLLYISKSYYPARQDVENGVKVSVLNWERDNPNIKIANHKYKEVISEKIKEEMVFEVLLVDNEGKITEGSRSNVFFIKDLKVFTAPEHKVLKGITRKYVLDACVQAGYEIVEQQIATDELEMVEGLFLSGTSIKVLPVSAIDNRIYSSGTNSAVMDIRNKYDEIMLRYIKRH